MNYTSAVWSILGETGKAKFLSAAIWLPCSLASSLSHCDENEQTIIQTTEEKDRQTSLAPQLPLSHSLSPPCDDEPNRETEKQSNKQTFRQAQKTDTQTDKQPTNEQYGCSLLPILFDTAVTILMMMFTNNAHPFFLQTINQSERRISEIP